MIIIGRPKNINQLNTPNIRFKNAQRKEVPIALIDDEKFEYLDDLKTHGFDISYFEDIVTIDSLLAYEIILCDIKGIGKKFKSKYEGAHIMKEINKKYPFKTIIAFSAYTYDPSYNSYLAVTDDIIKKDIELDEWIDKLDFAIKIATDPINKWIKIRNYLLERKVSLFDISLLEHEYVSLILDGKDLTNFPSKKRIKNIPQDLRGVLQSFTGSLIFKLIFL